MRSTAILAAALVLLAATGASAAPPLEGKTLELNGNTSLAFSKQTLTPEGESDGLDNNVTNVGVGLTYFVTSMLGIGVTGAYNKLTMAVPEQSMDLSSQAFGGILKLRFPLGDRAAVFVSGAAGITKLSTSGTDSESADVDGKYYGAGAGVNVFVLDRVSFDVVGGYQKTSFSSGEDGDLSGTGLTATVGLSIYFGGS